MNILDKLRDIVDRYNNWNADREDYVPVKPVSWRRPWGWHNRNKD